jgi:prephenate dehydrogenase
MWRDICLGNRTALLEALGAYRGDLETLSEAVASADGEALEAIFSRAKQTRDAYRHWFET